MVALNFLPDRLKAAAMEAGNRLCEIRLRRERPLILSLVSGEELVFDAVPNAEFSRMAAFLMGHSLYAKESELAGGYIILKNGCRAGISGTFTGTEGQITDISDIASICIRFAREAKGCADAVMDIARVANGIIIISPPGLGKTTLLRDIVRRLSEEGENISLMDERGEIAACRNGAPYLDVGPRTDIYSMCPKAEGIFLAIRAMAPDIIAVDELGADDDAAAVREAVRSGVKILATCHGKSLDTNAMRGCARNLVREGIFNAGILLGPGRGQIKEIKKLDGGFL